MLWIALHLPTLSLDAFAATLGDGRDTLPLALLDGHRVAAANPVARQLGVEPGCKRATALALAPQLRFGSADARRDAQALRAVAHAALAFTPMVAIDADTTRPCVLLEVQGSLRYFGGLPRLQQRLRAALGGLQPLVFGHRLASAPTAAGAALLARWRAGLELGAHVDDLGKLQALVDAAPLALLGPAHEHAETLQGMGLRTLGDWRRLPRSGLGRRFGEALLQAVDQVRGKAPDPRRPVVPEATFEARFELHERADRSEQLLAAAAVLLARLVAWAQAQHARIGGFTLALRHEPRHRADASMPERTDLSITLAEPSNDARHLQVLLRERLGRVVLPAPTLELRLRCDRLQRGPAPNGELFPTSASAREGLARLIERLQARLGPERVQQPVLVEDHRPERATAWQPVQPSAGGMTRDLAGHDAAAGGACLADGRTQGNPGPPHVSLTPTGGGLGAGPWRHPQAIGLGAAGLSGPTLTRPVWLLASPQPLPERQSRPWLDGAPLHLLAGPERIESGWWDGALAVRDYFIARAGDGTLVWIYRARLPPADAAGEGWFLHGRFA